MYTVCMRYYMYHVTPRRNVPQIMREGLLVKHAKGKTKGIWLAHALRLPWLVCHISRHQKTRQEDLSILVVEVTDLPLRQIRQGIKVVSQDITTNQICDVLYYAIGEPE